MAPAAVRSPAAVRRLVLQRGKKRKKRKDSGDHDDHDDSAHEEATKIKNVQRIQFGKYMIDTWYYSPFPRVRPPPPSRRRAAADGGQLLVALCEQEYLGYRTLYFCEFTLKFFRTEKGLLRHMVRRHAVAVPTRCAFPP